MIGNHSSATRFLATVAFIFLFLPVKLFSQGYVQNIYQEDSLSYHYNAVIDASGGMLTAAIESYSSTGAGRLVHYLDASGNWQWTVKLPQLHELCTGVAQNGNFLVAGYNYFDQNVILIRMNNTGQILWSYQYGNQYEDLPEEVHELQNGTIEILGSTRDTAAGTLWTPFRMQLSSTGTLLQTDAARSTPAFNFYHFAFDPASGNYLAFSSDRVALLDPSFHFTWFKKYTYAPGYFRFETADFTAAGNIIMGGVLNDGSRESGMLVMFDSTGNVLSASKYLKGMYSHINAVKVLASGNIAVAGGATVLSKYVYNGQYRMKSFAFIADPTGNVLHGVTFHQELSSEAMSLNLKNDSTLLMSGEYSTNWIDDGFFYIKTDTALWTPGWCSFDEAIPDSSITLTVTSYSLFQTVQINYATQSFTPTIITSVTPQLINSCPTKTLFRTQYDGKALFVAPVHNGSVLMAGYSMMPSHDALCLTNYTTEGDELWSYEFDCLSSVNNIPDYPYCAIETSDHGFVVGGGPDASMSTDGGIFLMKIDSVGNPVSGSTRFTVNNQQSNIKRIREDQSHDLIAMAGINMKNFTAACRFALLKYDSLGHLKWSKTYFNDHSIPGDVIVMGNYYYAVGYNDTSAIVIKTDTAGTVIWSKQVSIGGGPNRMVQFYTMAPAANNEFIAAGCIKLGTGLHGNPIIFRFDTAGNITWVKDFSVITGNQASATYITNLKGDRFLVTINADDGSTATDRGYQVLLKGNGVIQWTRQYNYDSEGGSSYHNSALAKDSSIILSSYKYANLDYHRFIKMTRFGEGPSCIASSYSISVHSTTGIIIQSPGLSATNLVMTENFAGITRAVDTLHCGFQCSSPDTSYYSSQSGGVGIEESFVYSSGSNQFILFPNPATDQINIRSDHGIISHVYVFNNCGQQVPLSTTLSENEAQLNIDGLMPGYYFVQIEMKDGTIGNLRCVKGE